MARIQVSAAPKHVIQIHLDDRTKLAAFDIPDGFFLRGTGSPLFLALVPGSDAARARGLKGTIMDKELLKPLLSGVARQSIAALGTYLGFTGTQEAQFIGAGMVLASLGWEWWQVRGERQVIAILAKMKPVAPENATTAQAAKAGSDAAKAELAK